MFKGATVLRGNGALVHSLIVSSAPTTLLGVIGHNNRSTDVYLQLHAGSAVPSNGAVPLLSMQCFANLIYSHPLPAPVQTQGCILVASTTLATLTITTGTNATDKVTIQAITRG